MRLLIIGNLSGPLGTAGRIAAKKGAKVAHVDTTDMALEALRSGQSADLIMCEVIYDIAAFINSLLTERITVPVVACGIGVTSEQAVAAIKAGAKEFIPLPPDADMIAAVLEAACEEDSTFIANSAAMQPILHLIAKVSPSNATVLITGESGTGKEVIARQIHKKSKRAVNNFVSVNCAAIPENLIESELFGHEKGAFTGAVAKRIGKFEEANNGTLLLDEISEMDLKLQAKLLRAIQEREIDRIGGSSPVKVDVRLIATSNRNLESEVKAGKFREDLYFRLNVIKLRLPPLRERREDIIPISEHMIQKYAKANGFEDKVLSNGAKILLESYEWKGNVRELENAMYAAVLMSEGNVIEESNIIISEAENSNSRQEASLVGRTVADVEKDLIINTLSHCFGNRTHAANILGISIRTLRNKLRQYSSDGIPIPASSLD
ncbi:MAG: sigma-54 dependent transcriptional regulator [Alphaproteobacteria bacterium]|nr:sigma-54 dependent transcriptional regulator [Alphaproteobacteria bacterium]MCL2505737.1 sigma-54 dependent transcriptional regulator [Alphaproteobacteria bacterium]